VALTVVDQLWNPRAWEVLEVEQAISESVLHCPQESLSLAVEAVAAQDLVRVAVRAEVWLAPKEEPAKVPEV
jgi:hypothetical protein